LLSKRLKEQSGYSLVEVLAAIIILALAIIPMVGMFDAGLRAASTSGNYDKARALANQKLEQAKSLPYETVRTNFPSGTGAPGASGSVTSSPQPAPAEEFSGISSYRVEKQYLEQPPTDSDSDPSSATESFQESNSAADTGLIRVTVTVTWGSSNTYSVTGLVAR
jgi:prepilin-type N-terminal cleavage/methylation domain-containing protein